VPTDDRDPVPDLDPTLEDELDAVFVGLELTVRDPTEERVEDPVVILETDCISDPDPDLEGPLSVNVCSWVLVVV